MIPMRIAVKDFLTYAAEEGDRAVVFDLDGACLWSIAGDNGAGKSALFDAITWTLFGQHRGGARGDERLVRRGSPACYASFEFRVDGHIYRAERSLTVGGARPHKTWQASVFDPDAGDWRPIPGTDAKAGFEDWVEHKLRLRYDTFIASTLLLQGQSDRLILAGPKDRFGILAGLLDLRRYEELADLARERTSIAGSELKRLDGRLAGLPVVDDEMLQHAQQDAERLANALAEAQARLERAVELQTQAKLYAQLLSEHEAKRAELAQAETAIADGERIRADHRERAEIVAALPKLEATLDDLTVASANDTSATADESEAARIDLTALEERARSASEDRRAADAALETARAELARCDEDRLAVAHLMGELDRCEQLEKLVAADETAAAGLREARVGRDTVDDRVAALRLVRDAKPLLERALAARRGVADREEALVAVGAVSDWTEVVRVRGEQLSAAKAAKATADGDLSLRQAAHATAEARLDLARAALAERGAAKDEAVCSRCGQAIDADHIATELAQAEAAVTSAERSLAEAVEQLRGAEERQRQAAREVEQLAQRLGEDKTALLRAEAAAAELTKAKRVLASAEEDIAASGPAIAATVAMLIALDEGQRAIRLRELGDLPALEKSAADLRDKESRLDAIEERIATLRVELSPLQQALPEEERERRRERRRALDEQREELLARLDSAQNSATAAETADEAAATTLADERQRHRDLLQKARQFRAAAEGRRATAAVRIADLPDMWQARARNADAGLLGEVKVRRDALADADERYAELVRAERGHDRLASEVGGITERIERIAPEQRIPVAEADVERERAAEARRAAQDQRDAANERLGELRGQRQRRRDLETEAETTRRLARLYGRLADLLGRRGLQAHLVDGALKDVEALANEMLGRISDHQLELHLRRETTSGGDEEIVIRTTDHRSADEPLDIEFISGGQKFRVAVALAAAIGQYTGGLRGGPRALIVDEGFGSLDAGGRQEMIRELHALAQYLERVVVVSHHDDFRDAVLFPSRYVISRDGQATTVARFV